MVNESFRDANVPSLMLCTANAIADVSYPSARSAAESKARELDKHYNQRLVSRPGDPQSAYRANIGLDDGRKSQYTASIVIGRMKEDLPQVQWVYDNLHDIQPAIYIVDDNTTTDQLHLAWNHGREAAVYFSYIIEHYDTLSDVTFFWHGEDEVWHNSMLLGWNSSISVNRMNRDYVISQGYVGSRCDHWPGCPYWVRFNPSRAEDRLDPHRLEGLFNPETFTQLFPDVSPNDFPPFFAGTCCSQFAVSRDAIQRHPKDFYENLRRWTMNWDNNDAETGRVLEYTWPYIFTGRGQSCPSMQDCYCKTYNFCIEDMEQLENLERWNALRSRREEVQWQLNFAKDALESRMDYSVSIGMSDDDLAEVEMSFQPEINRLAYFLGNLSDSTWLTREEIIHYWKLPVPPTGW